MKVEFDRRIDGLLRYAPSDGQIYMAKESAGLWRKLMEDEGAISMIPENIIVVDHISSMITEPYERDRLDHPKLSENIKTVGCMLYPDDPSVLTKDAITIAMSNLNDHCKSVWQQIAEESKMTNEEINQEMERFVRHCVQPRYKHVIVTKQGLSLKEFLKLRRSHLSPLFRKEYRILSGLFKKWRKRLRYREFKGKAKRGY